MSTVQRIARAGLLAASAVVAAQLLRFPILPAAPYLIYEPSDVPLLLAAFLLGPGWAAAAALCVALTLAGGGGPVGMVSRFVGSAALGVTAALVYRRLPEGRGRVGLATGAGVLAYVLVEVLATPILGPLFFGISPAEAAQLILPIVLPFNVIKGCANGLLAIGVHQFLVRLLSRETGRQLPTL